MLPLLLPLPPLLLPLLPSLLLRFQKPRHGQLLPPASPASSSDPNSPLSAHTVDKRLQRLHTGSPVGLGLQSCRQRCIQLVVKGSRSLQYPLALVTRTGTPTSNGHCDGPLGAAEHEGAAHCHVGSLTTGILHRRTLGSVNVEALQHCSHTLCTLHDSMYAHHQSRHRVPHSSRAMTACEEANTRQVYTIGG